MNINMNGKPIHSIWLETADGLIEIAAGMGQIMELSATRHGDRDEFWVIMSHRNNDIETTRFNCKYISRITWL